MSNSHINKLKSGVIKGGGGRGEGGEKNNVTFHPCFCFFVVFFFSTTIRRSLTGLDI